jgi:transposase
MREDVPMSKKARRSFNPEQKSDAVRLVKQVGNLSQVARDLDVNPNVLRNWVKQSAIDAGNDSSGPLTTEERAELTRLRRETRTLQMERDFLKKAAAFFAKEQDRPAS